MANTKNIAISPPTAPWANCSILYEYDNAGNLRMVVRYAPPGLPPSEIEVPQFTPPGGPAPSLPTIPAALQTAVANHFAVIFGTAAVTTAMGF